MTYPALSIIATVSHSCHFTDDTVHMWPLPHLINNKVATKEQVTWLEESEI